MTKVMLVEDDNNLREIYSARLLAEGYEIVSAKDGEEALALAVKEKPDLIITDIMMPKISGFDMLDILRTTPETKNTKVIMMTALSQAEDKARADKLGADRYLVKSQVSLEDVAKTAREVLGGEAPTPITAPVLTAEGKVPEEQQPAAPTAQPLAEQPASPTPVAVQPEPPVEPVIAAPETPPAATESAPQDTTATNTPPPEPPQPTTNTPPTVIDGAENIETVEVPETTTVPEEKGGEIASPTSANTANEQVLENAAANLQTDSKPAPKETEGESTDNHAVLDDSTPNEPSKTSVHTKVINPINDITKPTVDLEKLAEAEGETLPTGAKVINDVTAPVVTTTTDENIAPEPEVIKPTDEPSPPNA